ncbi:MAG: hypothetical protein EB084_12295 [Proteobacteria bacterium]|nr:hypothetical protein [Pseudomonadota bacterium]
MRNPRALRDAAHHPYAPTTVDPAVWRYLVTTAGGENLAVEPRGPALGLASRRRREGPRLELPETAGEGHGATSIIDDRKVDHPLRV